jgi:hypothetical protein
MVLYILARRFAVSTSLSNGTASPFQHMLEAVGED